MYILLDFELSLGNQLPNVIKNAKTVSLILLFVFAYLCVFTFIIMSKLT